MKSHNVTHCSVLCCPVLYILYCIVGLHLCIYVPMCLCMCSGTSRFGCVVSSDNIYPSNRESHGLQDDDGSARDLLAHGVMEFALSREVTATAAHEARLCNRIMGSLHWDIGPPGCLVLSVECWVLVSLVFFGWGCGCIPSSSYLFG